MRPEHAPEITRVHSFKPLPVCVPVEARRLVHSQYIPFCALNELMA